jgi:hypothetical protein
MEDGAGMGMRNSVVGDPEVERFARENLTRGLSTALHRACVILQRNVCAAKPVTSLNRFAGRGRSFTQQQGGRHYCGPPRRGRIYDAMHQ